MRWWLALIALAAFSLGAHATLFTGIILAPNSGGGSPPAGGALLLVNNTDFVLLVNGTDHLCLASSSSC